VELTVRLVLVESERLGICRRGTASSIDSSLHTAAARRPAGSDCGWVAVPAPLSRVDSRYPRPTACSWWY